MAGAETKENFPCSVENFYSIITDYEKYSEFLDEVDGCRVVETKENKKLVEFRVKVIKEFTYRLWITEEPPHRIHWVFDSGDLFKVSNGSWDLKEQGGQCVAHYAVDAKFKVFVPGPIAKTLVKVNLPNMMKNYHSRVKQLFG
ncbi:MAG: SRPBCC family protein [Bdellovibrionales bacterium]|nr:SRPBCC family protein [Bdellovibrionales bacterium]